MRFGLEKRLLHWRERHRDRILTVLAIFLLLLLFVIAPLQAHAAIVFEALGLIVALLMIVVLVMSGSRIAFIRGDGLCADIAAIVLRLHKPSTFGIYLIAGAWITIAIALGTVVGRAVFRRSRLTYHRIVVVPTSGRSRIRGPVRVRRSPVSAFIFRNRIGRHPDARQQSLLRVWLVHRRADAVPVLVVAFGRI
jgi:hypothetical protein